MGGLAGSGRQATRSIISDGFDPSRQDDAQPITDAADRLQRLAS